MAVRRKSNWYVYFISFGIALVFALVAIFAFKWYLFPEDTEPVGLEQNGELTDDFKPTAEHNFNLLAMLSDDSANDPDLFVMVEYNAVGNKVAFVPVPVGISVNKDGRTLPNIYAAQGGGGVITAIENAVGVRCDSYVKFDRTQFQNLVSVFGNIEYALPKTLIIKDNGRSETFNAGVQMLTAESVYKLIMIADFQEGESYRFNCIGDILSELINQNYRNIDSSLLDSYFKLMLDSSENDLTEQKYTAHKAALLNTIEYGASPAEYYIPYGEYTSDGGFDISDNSITSIKQKAGLI